MVAINSKPKSLVVRLPTAGFAARTCSGTGRPNRSNRLRWIQRASLTKRRPHSSACRKSSTNVTATPCAAATIERTTSVVDKRFGFGDRNVPSRSPEATTSCVEAIVDAARNRVEDILEHIAPMSP